MMQTEIVRELTAQQILQLIPQRRPFRFVDEITAVTPTSIEGHYTFRHDESFYAGHFPGQPLTPGVILLESMCQIGVVALGIYLLALEQPLEEVGRWSTLFVEAQTEFMMQVLPGDKVIVRAERVLWRRRKLRCKIEMYNSNGQIVAQATASGLGVRKP